MATNPASAPIVGYSGPSDTSDQQYWLDVAWRALLLEDRSIATRMDDGTLDSATVADVVTAAARRVLRNPDGVEQESGGIDDYTESVKWRDATEDIYFTSAELRRLGDPGAALVGFSGSFKYC